MEINQLHERFLESSGICTDTRKLQKNNFFIALKGDNFNGNNFAEKALQEGSSTVIVDEKQNFESENIILVEDGLQTLQQLATYHRKFLNLPIIAITGSNGKTTTKELIKEVLRTKYRIQFTQGNLNNHIGVPLTLLSMNNETEMGVVEMGANHQGEIEKLCEIALPDYGYITNFGKAHLEGFGGVEGVIKGKSELYRHLIKNDKTIFINYDDEIQREKTESAQVVSFSEGREANYQINLKKASPYVEMTTPDFEIQSNLIGIYNSKNIAVAICIGKYFNIPDADIQKAIEGYIPSNNRSQIIKKDSNQIIMDAYNANPTSMKAALENLHNLEAESKAVILGDMFEIGKTSPEEHQKIVDLTESFQFEKIFICGSHFNKTKTSEAKKFETFDEMKEALKKEKFNYTSILIKGSRGMQLERVLDFL